MKPFSQVFPYEYQRALSKQLEDANQEQLIPNGSFQTLNGEKHPVKDIEDAVADIDMEQRKLDKIR